MVAKDRRVVETIHVKIDESKNGVYTLFGRERSKSYYGINNDKELEVDDEIEEETKRKVEVQIPKEVDISKWKTIEKEQKNKSRVDIYYYPPESNQRLRSQNDARTYCEENGLQYKVQDFNFKPKQIEEIDEESEQEPDEEVDEEEEIANLLSEESYCTEVSKNL